MMARGQASALTQQIQRKKSATDAMNRARVSQESSSSIGISASDARTPLAWQHRNLNYQQLQEQQAQYLERITVSAAVETQTRASEHLHQAQVQGAVPSRGRRPSSSSSGTTATSRSCTSADVQSRTHNRVLPTYPGATSAMVATGTWDGEPCPVHHLPPAISAILSPPSPPTIMLPQMTLSRHNLPPSYIPNTLPGDKGIYMLLPPMMRPRQLVLPAAESTSGHPEPLPVRDPKSTTNNLFPSKDVERQSESSNCHGHTIVLWFIITIITIGIVLGAVLRFVMS